MINIQTPLAKQDAAKLRAGDRVLISGVIYSARDAAHKKMTDALARGEELPFDIKDQIIYYMGPCPAKPGQIIGSCGPTTSGRMDSYTPQLLDLGMTGMIGKGERTAQVYASMRKNGAVYFGAIGGAGALIAKSIEKVEVIAYPELLSESLKKLTVKDFPAIVIADVAGANLYL